MLSRALRRTLLDSRYGVPPTFLLPWAASLSTVTAAPEPQTLPPSLQTQSTQTYSPPHAGSKKGASPPSSDPVQLSQSVRELLPVLRAQRQIYLSAHIHGKSYLITEGDTVRLPFCMKDADPGDVIRLNRAILLGSRDLTLKSSAGLPKFRRDGSEQGTAMEITLSDEAQALQTKDRTAPHFIPHIAKDKHSYLDERFFVCRALVTGVESEPLRVMEKTKRRQRHVKHVKSKHRYTILKISELRVRSLEEIENGDLD